MMPYSTSGRIGKRTAWCAAVTLTALLLVVGCSDEPQTPLEPPDETDTAEALTPTFAQQLTCRVDVAEAEMDCGPASTQSGDGAEGSGLDLIVGSQHQFVRLADGGPDLISEPGKWIADVTVQNLTLQPFGTADGESAESAGVRVFFVDEPSGDVEVSNYDGTDTFMGSGAAKYYEYSGSDLGTGGILASGETSTPKTWRFELNGETQFTFSVLIATVVPDEGAYGVSLSKVSAGADHACAEDSDGKAYCWGDNNKGQLGDGTTTDRSTPVAVDVSGVDGVELTNLSAGGFKGGFAHTCAEGSDGKAYCWGYNNINQLGDGSSDNSSTPVPVDVSGVGGVELSNLSVDGHHTCAEDGDGTVYCWGDGLKGQLGHGSLGGSTTPVEVDLDDVKLSKPTAGYQHTCAEGDDGNTYCWGDNSNGKLGFGRFGFNSPTPLKVDMTDVGEVEFSNLSAGKEHTCAEGNDGNAYCWGLNDDGQLGDGTTTDRSTPVPVDVSDMGGVKLTHLTTGDAHTCAEGSDGRAYCWGDNSKGQLGNGTEVDSSTPSVVNMDQWGGVELSNLSAGKDHTCADGPAGTIYCWGANARGQLGDGTTEGRLTPVIVAGSGGNP